MDPHKDLSEYSDDFQDDRRRSRSRNDNRRSGSRRGTGRGRGAFASSDEDLPSPEDRKRLSARRRAELSPLDTSTEGPIGRPRSHRRGDVVSDPSFEDSSDIPRYENDNRRQGRRPSSTRGAARSRSPSLGRRRGGRSGDRLDDDVTDFRTDEFTDDPVGPRRSRSRNRNSRSGSRSGSRSRSRSRTPGTVRRRSTIKSREDRASPRSTRSPSRANAAASAYMEKKAVRELNQLADNLRREVEEKDDEIDMLKEITNKGKLQKKLQVVLLENREMRKELDIFYEKKELYDSVQTGNADVSDAVQDLKDELYQTKREYDQEIRDLTEQLQAVTRDAGELEEQLNRAEEHGADLEGQLKDAQKQLIAKEQKLLQVSSTLDQMRDGSQIDQLEDQVAHLNDLLKEREEEAEILAAKLQETAHEFDITRGERDHFENGMQKQIEATLNETRLEISNLHRELEKKDQELSFANDRVRQLEQHAHTNDSRMLELQEQMQEYERGYGIQDAMKEIRSMKIDFRKQEEENVHMLNKLNKRERQMQQLLEENKICRRKAGMPEDWGLNAEELDLQFQLDIREAEAEALHNKRVIQHLEEDRAKLLDELRKGAVFKAEEGFLYRGLSPEQTRLVDDFAEKLRMGDNSLPTSDQSKQLQKKVKQLTQEVDDWRDKYARCMVEKEGLVKRLLQEGKGKQTAADKEEYKKLMDELGDLKGHIQRSMSQQGGTTSGDLNALLLQQQQQQEGEAGSAKQVLRMISRLDDEEQKRLTARLFDDAKMSAIRYAMEEAVTKGNVEFRDSVWRWENLPAGSGLSAVRSKNASSSLSGSGDKRQRDGGVAEKASAPEFVEYLKFPPFSPFTVRDGDSIPVRQTSKGDPVAQRTLVERRRAAELLELEKELAGAATEVFENEGALATATHTLSLYRKKFESLVASQQLLYEEFNRSKVEWRKKENDYREDLRKESTKAAEIELELKRVVGLNKRAEILASLSNPLSEREREIERQLEDYSREVMVLRTHEKVLARQYNLLEDEMKLLSEREANTKKDLIEMERVLRTRVDELVRMKETSDERSRVLEGTMTSWVSREQFLNLGREHELLLLKYGQVLLDSSQNAVRYSAFAEIRDENTELRERVEDLEMHMEVTEEKLKKERERNRSSRKKGKESSKQRSIDELEGEVQALTLREKNAQKATHRAREAVRIANDSIARLEAELDAATEKVAESHRVDAARVEELTKVKNSYEGSVPFKEAEGMRRHILQLKEELKKVKIELEHHKSTSTLASQQMKAMREHVNLHSEENKELRLAMREMTQISDDATIIGKLQHGLIQARLATATAENKATKALTRVTELESQVLKAQQEAEERNADFFRATKSYRMQLASRDDIIVALRQKTTPFVTVDQAELLHQTNARLSAKLEEERSRARKNQQETEKMSLRLEELKVELQSMTDLASVVDVEDENELKARQAHWIRQLKDVRLAEMKVKHECEVLRNQVAFLQSSDAEQAAIIGQLQQQIVERENQIHEKENEWRQRVAEIHAKSVASKIKDRLKGKAKGLVKKKGGVSSSVSLPSSASPPAVVSELTEKLSACEEQLEKQERTISELREKLRLMTESRDEERRDRDGHAQLKEADKQRILGTAQQTIESLHELVAQKNASIERYQKMMEKQTKKFKAQKTLDDAEIDRLNDQLLAGGEQNVDRLKTALTILQDLPGLPGDVVSQEYVESMQKEHERRTALLNAEVELLQEKLAQADSEANELAQRVADLEGDLEAMQREAVSKEEVEKREKQNRTILKKMKKRIATRENEAKQLKKKVKEMRADLMDAERYGGGKSSRKPRPAPVQPANLPSNTDADKLLKRLQLAQSHLRQYKAKASELEEKLKEREGEVANLKRISRAREEEARSYRSKIDKTESTWKKKTSLLKAKLTDAAKKSEGKSGADVAAVQNLVKVVEKNDHSAQVEHLQEELRVAKAEKDKAVKAIELEAEAVIASLKSETTKSGIRIAELEKEIEHVRKQANLPKTLEGFLQADVPFPSLSPAEMLTMEELRSSLFDAQEQCNELTKKLELTEKPELVRVQVENEQLRRDVERYERRQDALIAKLKEATEAGNKEIFVSFSELWNEMEETNLRLEDLEAKLLEAECENMELRFERENHELVRTRLYNRCRQLQQAYDSLKTTKGLKSMSRNTSFATLPTRDGSLKVEREKQRSATTTSGLKKPSSLSSSSHPHPPSSSSSASNDVDHLKKVIAQLKREKESAAKNAQSNVKYMEMKRENKKLKEQIERLEADVKEREEALTSRNTQLEQHQLSSKDHFELQRVTDLFKSTQKQLKRETEANHRLKKRVGELKEREEELLQTVERLENEVERQKRMSEAHLKQTREYLQTEIDAVAGEKERVEDELDVREEALQRLKGDLDVMTKKLDKLEVDYQVLIQEKAVLEGEVSREREQMQRERARERDQLGVSGSGNIEGRASIHGNGSLASRLQSELKLIREVEKLKEENEALREELSAFDLPFFDEIEDLKYRYTVTLENEKSLSKENEALKRKIQDLQRRRGDMLDAR